MLSLIKNRNRRSFLGCCQSRLIGCLVLLFVIGAIAAAIVFFLIPERLEAANHAPINSSQQNDSQAQTIHFLIDNSLSMYPLNGAGSDPDQLRIAATRLFISYLGVDASQLEQRVSIIFFGSQPDLIVPPAELESHAQRRIIFDQIANPEPFGWTDPAAALELATEQFEPNQQDVVVLLTDGFPEFEGVTMTTSSRERYVERLNTLLEALQIQQIPLFVILLTNSEGQISDATADEQAFWQATWDRLAQATPQGKLFTVSDPDQLTAVYHTVITTVSNRQSAGEITRQALDNDSIRVPVIINQPLHDMSFIISSGSSAAPVDVRIMQPDGSELSADHPHVQIASHNENELAEVWTILRPTVGKWELRISGSGEAAVWHDTSAPLPNPTATPLVATVTPKSAEAVMTPTQIAKPSPAISSPTPTRTKEIVLIDANIDSADPIEASEPSPPIEGAESAMSVKPRRSLWRWGLFTVLLGGGVVVALLSLTHRATSQPMVSGYLQPLMPNITADPSLLELDHFQAPSLSIGPADADIPLPGTVGSAHLTARAIRLGEIGVFLSGSDTVSVNKALLDVGQEIPLFDGDIVALDGIPFRYENLRLMR